MQRSTAPAHGRRAPLRLCATVGLVLRGNGNMPPPQIIQPPRPGQPSAPAAQCRSASTRRYVRRLCMGSVGALHSRRLRITREHAGGPGELARGMRLRGNGPCERLAGSAISLSMAPVGAARVTGS